ncbi:Crp/Fnr family transcriptional regulator [Aquihabitans daechungensis]|uniref:Crp/Fnr family transcriptional regulator n=1 Tax=Aquihabitans daechungensis TaxID=1052257 RepID=UPI003B9DF8F8
MTRTENALRDCPMFRAESRRTLWSLGRHAEAFDVASGRLLLVEGDPSNDLYLVLEGALVVHAQHQQLAYLPAGQLVGEIGVLTGRPRSACVETIAPSRIMRISGGRFRSAFHASSTLQDRTCDMLASRGAPIEAMAQVTAGIAPNPASGPSPVPWESTQ